MKLLFFKSNIFMQEDWLETLQRAGYDVDPITYVFTDYMEDGFFAKKFRRRLQKISYDAVLSFNFYPVISDICQEFHVTYISWIYDSPIPHFHRYDTPCNHVYHFDRIEVEELQSQGCAQVSHLPLAVNTERLDRQLGILNEMPEYRHDISFVGNLYTDRSIQSRNFVSSEYIQGILQGYAAAQTQFFHQDIAMELLENSPYINTHAFSQDFPVESLARAIQEEATHQERIHLLWRLSQHFPVDLYTSEHVADAGNLRVHPAIGYYTEMPHVFRHSRINLNINYRTIRSGMSARLLDVMGCGGFLLTTPQPELFDYFQPDRDFVAYSSLEELEDKCSYYLSHEEERHQIAKNGYEKIKKAHTYEMRFPALFSALHKHGSFTSV